MASISISRGMLLSHTDDVTKMLTKLRTLPPTVQAAMLNAEGKIIMEEQKKTAREMLSVDTGEYFDPETGVVEGLAVGKVKKNRNDTMYHVDVVFKGKQHGERRATIAFVNEYGALHMGRGSVDGEARIQRPRPFIQTANNRATNRALQAAEEIFFDYIEKET